MVVALDLHVHEAVVEHSDGNPYVVEELLAGLIASGALVHRDGDGAEHAREDHLRARQPPLPEAQQVQAIDDGREDLVFFGAFDDGGGNVGHGQIIQLLGVG